MFFVFLSVGALALFSFLAIVIWAACRVKERTHFYRAEMVKKIAESESGAAAALEYLREQDRVTYRRELQSISVGGLITALVGIAVLIFLHSFLAGSSLYLSGLFPLLVGMVLFVAPFFTGLREH
jgi:hypothetical protein